MKTCLCGKFVRFFILSILFNPMNLFAFNRINKDSDQKKTEVAKSLIKDGVEADAYSEASAQSLTLLNDSVQQLVVKAGWNLLSWTYSNWTIGYSAASFGNFNTQAEDYKKYSLLYHGGATEFVFFPASTFYGGITGHIGNGFIKFKNDEDRTIKTSAHILVLQFGASVFYRVTNYIHAGLQAGSSSVTYSKLENFTGSKNESSPYFSLSVRFTTF